MSNINRQVRQWFANQESVTRNLGAIKMARQMKANGKKFNHLYIGSGVPRKTFGAQKILDIASGIYDKSDPTERQFHELIVMQNSILGLYAGLRFAQMLGSGGATYITYYTPYTFKTNGKVKRKGNTRGYNNLAIIELYNTSPRTAAYPINEV